MKFSRSLLAKCAACALVVAAAGTASVAQARDHVTFSIGANIAPGVVVGATNAPYYYGPTYVAPAPVYYAPAPVYYDPAPVYYSAAPVIGVEWIWSPYHHRYYRWHHGHRVWR